MCACACACMCVCVCVCVCVYVCVCKFLCLSTPTLLQNLYASVKDPVLNLQAGKLYCEGYNILHTSSKYAVIFSEYGVNGFPCRLYRCCSNQKGFLGCQKLHIKSGHVLLIVEPWLYPETQNSYRLASIINAVIIFGIIGDEKHKT